MSITASYTYITIMKTLITIVILLLLETSQYYYIEDKYSFSLKEIDYKTKEDSLFSIVSDSNKILENYKDVHRALIYYDVPFPDVFTRVSILEKGWHYEHAPHNNIFGFNIPGLRFYTKRDAIIRLKRWCEYSPPKKRENGYQFLKRRGYNPYNFYINRVKSIKL